MKEVCTIQQVENNDSRAEANVLGAAALTEDSCTKIHPFLGRSSKKNVRINPKIPSIKINIHLFVIVVIKIFVVELHVLPVAQKRIQKHLQQSINLNHYL